ncbi:MAG: helix-turn-helix domain-containing protein, partial [Oscillospiraceae bacterium]|nr:helix-turn-helix domain-containing protein [Oscillospiraceae bacterium]
RGSFLPCGIQRVGVVMAFSLGYFANRLQDYHPRILNCDPAVTFDSVRVFSPDSGSYSSRLLYVADRSDLCRVAEVQRAGWNIIAICLGKEEDLPPEFAASCHLVLVDPEINFERFFSKLQTLSVYESFYKNMIRNIRHDSGSVQDLIELFAGSFYGSVILWDENLKPINISDPNCSMDANLINTFVQKDDTAKNLLAATLQNDCMESYDASSTVRIPEAGDRSFSAFFHHVVFKGTRILSIMLISPLNVANSTKYADELYFVVNALEELYLARLNIQHFIDPKKEFMRGIVDGDWSEPALALAKAKEFGLPTDLQFLFCVIDIREYSAMQALIFTDSLSQALPAVPMIKHDGSICMMRQLDSSLSAAHISENLFSARLQRYRTPGGVSRVTIGLDQANRAYLQAKTALRLGKRDKEAAGQNNYLFYYKDYFRFESLEHLEQQYGDLLCQLPRKLQLLLEHSLTDDTNLLLIETYLAAGQSTSLTAEKLNMHRNTVIYRLKKLSE